MEQGPLFLNLHHTAFIFHQEHDEGGKAHFAGLCCFCRGPDVNAVGISGFVFLETHFGLALVWSPGLHAHLQLEHIFQFSSSERNPGHELQVCFMV